MAFIFRPLMIVRLVNDAYKTKHRSFSISTFRYGTIVPFKLTDIGEGIKEVTVKEWYVKPGDKVAQFENICEVQSDKASVTITSRYDGIIKTLYCNIDDVVLVGSPLVDIEVDESASSAKNVEVDVLHSEERREFKEPTEPSQDKKHTRKVLATPAVRRLARENKIDLKNVTATGENLRITTQDVKVAIFEHVSPAKKEETTVNTEHSQRTITQTYKKQMWKSMTQSLSIPHFVYKDECNVTKLVKLKKELDPVCKRHEIDLTYTPFLMKATSKALEKTPECNAWVNVELQDIQILNTHNISVAVDTPHGLVVPNIKDVQNLNIPDIAKKLQRIIELAQREALAPGDLRGGTICLSNIGSQGGTYMKPIIYSPQVAIIVTGRIQKLPRYDEAGNLVPTDILPISLAGDHRVLDGAKMASFAKLWKYYLEHPLELIFGL